MENTSFLCNYILLFNGQWFCLCSLSLVQETYTCSRFEANNYRDKLFEEKLRFNLYFFNYFTGLKQYDSSTFVSEAREWPMESGCCINKHMELCLCPSLVTYTSFGYQPFISPAVKNTEHWELTKSKFSFSGFQWRKKNGECAFRAAFWILLWIQFLPRCCLNALGCHSIYSSILSWAVASAFPEELYMPERERDSRKIARCMISERKDTQPKLFLITHSSPYITWSKEYNSRWM